LKLILVRHGNTFEADQIPIQVGARTDLSLTKEGLNQAVRFASIVKPMNPLVFSGPLKRHIEMAECIGEFQIEPALTEIDYGLWEGLTAEEIRLKWPKEHADWEQGKWPHAIFGTTEQWHRQLLEKWLQALPQNQTVVAITSNGILRLFHNEKVKTGHYCELTSNLEVKQWNIKP